MGCKQFFLKERKNVMFFKQNRRTLLPCCILCCLPASQAVLKRFRRRLVPTGQTHFCHVLRCHRFYAGAEAAIYEPYLTFYN